VQGERGREEKRGDPKGEGDQRKGGQRWDVRHLHSLGGMKGGQLVKW